MFQAYTHTDGREFMLGKKKARFDSSTPKFESYYDKATAVPPPPNVNYYGTMTSFGMMLNNIYGNCTIASKGHGVQVCSYESSGTMITVPDPTILHYYSKWDGYVPGDPETDQGGVILDVLQDWKKQTFDNHQLLAYTSVNPTNVDHVLNSIYWFGDLDIGLELPLTAQAQVGGIWDVVGDPNNSPNSKPGSWGGHDVSIGKYSVATDGTIMLYPITWGAIQAMTWDFFVTYCDEAYALLLKIWLNSKWAGGSPCGFDGQQLIADGNRVAN